MNSSKKKAQIAMGYGSSDSGSFVDRLRNTDFQKEESRKQQYEITCRAEKFAEVIRSACTSSARSGSRSVKGYVHEYLDDGYSEIRFESELPSIEKYEQFAREYNSKKYYEGMRYMSDHRGKREFLLYDVGWYLTKDPVYAESFKSALFAILKNDGFSVVNLRILNEPVTYVTEVTKVKFLGPLMKTISLRSTNERVYILEIMVQW